MSKRILGNKVLLALCTGVLLLAMVPFFTGCPSPQAETPPAYVLQWGAAGNGNGQFNSPYGVAIDTTGSVYVTDMGNNRIQKFDANGGYLTQWGAFGTGNGQFDGPLGIAVDATGNLYVVDNLNNRVQKFSGSGTYLTQWGSFGAGNGQFNNPEGVVVDASGNVYVSDKTNNRIQKFSNTGSYLSQWGTYGGGNGQFNSPRLMAIDSTGNIYIVDSYSNRIQKFSGTGSYLTQWGAAGTGNGQFNMPVGVAIDAAGKIYITDAYNSRVQKFSNTGTYLTQWGSQGTGNGQFNDPIGIAIDANGNVYVADEFNNRIQKFGLPNETSPLTTQSFTATPLFPGTVIVNATLDGVAWPGSVSFTLTSSSSPITGSTVPQTYTDMPVDTYTLAYNSGTPPSASFVGITSSATQALTAGGTITFTLNFTTKTAVRTGTVIVNATLDNVAWTGSVSFSVAGPSAITGTSVPLTSTNRAVGSYTLSYLSGGPSGASFVSITSSATQTLTAGGTITFTLNFETKTAVRTGTIIVNATLDGSAWTGVVNFSVTGASPFSGSSVPQNFTSYPVGNYTLAYVSGGPTGAAFLNITSSATQTLTAGGTITFTLNFTTSAEGRTGTIIVNATWRQATGIAPWTGTVYFTLSGPSTFSGNLVNQTFTSVPVGIYTLTYISGGPPGTALLSITVSATQSLTAGNTITFTLNFQ